MRHYLLQHEIVNTWHIRLHLLSAERTTHVNAVPDILSYVVERSSVPSTNIRFHEEPVRPNNILQAFPIHGANLTQKRLPVTVNADSRWHERQMICHRWHWQDLDGWKLHDL